MAASLCRRGWELRTNGEIRHLGTNGCRRVSHGPLDLLAYEMFAECGEAVRKAAGDQQARRVPFDEPDGIAYDIGPQTRAAAENEGVVQSDLHGPEPVPCGTGLCDFLDRNELVEQAAIRNDAQSFPVA